MLGSSKSFTVINPNTDYMKVPNKIQYILFNVTKGKQKERKQSECC